jgi:hypothetical protein
MNLHAGIVGGVTMRTFRSFFRATAGLGVLIACVSAGPVLAVGMFPSESYDGGLLPNDIASGDFNGDGILDLAVLNQGQTTTQPPLGPAAYRVLFGNGDGSFRPCAPFSLNGGDAQYLMAGDLNGDGKSDLVIDMVGVAPFQVLLSNGDCTFTAAPDVPAGSNALLADWTGDSKLDLMIVRLGTTPPTIEVRRGVGDGTFVSTPLGQIPVQTISFPFLSADLNNDGRPDLVAGTGNLGIRTFINNGDGSFQQILATANGKMDRGVLADMDGDGKVDIVIASRSLPTNAMEMYRGDGHGFFGPSPAWHIDLNGDAFTLNAADINGDGRIDIVLMLAGSGVSVYLGQAGGVALHETIYVGSQPYRSVLANFDGKNGKDLAYVSPFELTTYVFLSDKDGNLAALTPNPTPLPFGSVFRAGLLEDFNEDGIPDLAAMHCDTQTTCDQVGVAPGLPGGFFGAAIFYPAGIDPSAMTAADVNGDGHLDLLAVNQESSVDLIVPGTLSVLFGLGNGTFLPQTSYGVGYGPTALLTGDLNEDGAPDVVVIDTGYSDAGYQGDIAIRMNNGHGTFGPDQRILTGLNPRDVKIGDFDGDGHLDLATATKGFYPDFPAEVDIRRGLGNGTFGPPQAIGTGISFTSIAAGDLDSDGDLDIVATDLGNTNDPLNVGNAVVFLNHGGLHFTAAQTLIGGSSPDNARLQDVNGDGIDDFWTDNFNSYDISIYPGRGDGTFAPGERYTVLGYTPLLIGQFDGDPRPDLIVGGGVQTFGILNIGQAAPQIRMGPPRDLVSWTGVPLTSAYDLVKGNLATLHTGGLTPSILACLQSDGAPQSVSDPALPARGQGFFYMARARKPTGDPGTYDGEGPGQIAPRDAAIDASSFACP